MTACNTAWELPNTLPGIEPSGSLSPPKAFFAWGPPLPFAYGHSWLCCSVAQVLLRAVETWIALSECGRLSAAADLPRRQYLAN